jgi:hypothetical protein
MKPKKPLPKTQPFLTILTATYCRPAGLAALLKSVHQQTIAHEIEHIVLPDYIGVSPNDAVYGRLPWYVDAIRGEYVHVLGDDDVLAAPDVVARVKAFARAIGNPPVVRLKCQKGDQVYPLGGVHSVALKEGDVDLCNFIISREAFVSCMKRYQPYVCDWGFVQLLEDYLNETVHKSVEAIDMLYAVGKVGGGRPEAVDW